MKVQPGDKITIQMPECPCGAGARTLEMTILFGDAEEHDMWVAKVDGTKYHVLVTIDENQLAVCQPCGTYRQVQHMLSVSDSREDHTF